MAPALVAWDFDGVLNRNLVDGQLVWHRDFTRDLGVPVEDFADYLFRSGRFREVLVGTRDLRDLLADWIAHGGHDLTPEDVMSYWFARDAHPDADILDLVKRCPARSVIATSNEAHRASYIWHDMGYSAHMERIFAAGPMGLKKPEAAFFAEIESWSGVAPEAILLVDDSAANVEAAASRGWQSFHFTDATRDALPARLGLV